LKSYNNITCKETPKIADADSTGSAYRADVIETYIQSRYPARSIRRTGSFPTTLVPAEP
jgi:hypothetical protein